MQPYDPIMCGYFCIEFIDFMLKGKNLLDYTLLTFPNGYENNVKIMLKYFQLLKISRWKKFIALFIVSIENSKSLKYHIFSKKH